MSYRLHSNASTTPKTRIEIRESTLTIKELMARYSITKATVLKWRKRTQGRIYTHST